MSIETGYLRNESAGLACMDDTGNNCYVWALESVNLDYVSSLRALPVDAAIAKFLAFTLIRKSLRIEFGDLILLFSC